MGVFRNPRWRAKWPPFPVFLISLKLDNPNIKLKCMFFSMGNSVKYVFGHFEPCKYQLNHLRYSQHPTFHPKWPPFPVFLISLKLDNQNRNVKCLNIIMFFSIGNSVKYLFIHFDRHKHECNRLRYSQHPKWGQNGHRIALKLQFPIQIKLFTKSKLFKHVSNVKMLFF